MEKDIFSTLIVMRAHKYMYKLIKVDKLNVHGFPKNINYPSIKLLGYFYQGPDEKPIVTRMWE